MGKTDVKRIKMELLNELAKIDKDINVAISTLLQKCNKTVTRDKYLTKLEIEDLIDTKIADAKRGGY